MCVQVQGKVAGGMMEDKKKKSKRTGTINKN